MFAPTFRAHAAVPLLSASLFLGAMALLIGGCVGATEESCAPGEECRCSGAGACERTCEGEGCLIECEGAGVCETYCDEGGCEVFQEGTGAATLHCDGNNCEMTCSGAGACEMVGCTENCQIHCRGAGSCEMDCDGPTCTID